MQDCPAGKYCVEQTTSGTGAPDCDYGKQCPTGSLEQIPCDAGTYQDQQGQASCIACEAGNYCAFEYTLTSGTSQKHTCPAGYTCIDTSMGAPTPCSAGYYHDSTGQSVACLSCPAGYYCPLQAVGDYTAYPCPDQFYCPAGSSEPTLCIDGYLCEQATAGSQDTQTACPAGYYCIAGFKYSCFAGYLCMGGASVPAPTDGSTGKLCDQGYYCLAGATTQTECGTGNYQSSFGASDASMCLPCPSGTACTGTANIYYTQITCTAGYICPGDGTETPCDAGMMCPSGAITMQKCASGTYQANTA